MTVTARSIYIGEQVAAAAAALPGARVSGSVAFLALKGFRGTAKPKLQSPPQLAPAGGGRGLLALQWLRTPAQPAGACQIGLISRNMRHRGGSTPWVAGGCTLRGQDRALRQHLRCLEWQMNLIFSKLHAPACFQPHSCSMPWIHWQGMLAVSIGHCARVCRAPHNVCHCSSAREWQFQTQIQHGSKLQLSQLLRNHPQPRRLAGLLKGPQVVPLHPQQLERPACETAPLLLTRREVCMVRGTSSAAEQVMMRPNHQLGAAPSRIAAGAQADAKAAGRSLR